MIDDANYTASRVMTATPLQLVLITYEALLEELKDSITNLKLNKIKQYDKNLNNSRNIIRELIHSLDIEYKPADDLLAIYAYCQKLINAAQFRKDISKVEECIKVLTPLYEGWQQAEQITAGEINKTNKQPMVAGMTYGKSDIDMVGDYSQGFKA